MGSSENFCLRWNDFEANVSGAFRDLRAESDFFDVTLACDNSQGRTLQAHRVILSACSSFFKQMLRNTAVAAPGHPNPLLYLRGVRLSDLESVLDFMYHGEVNVAQDDLNSFLAVAEDLQVKGLTQQTTKDLGGVTKKTPGRKSASGPAAKRRRQNNDDPDMDDDLSMTNVKNEPSFSAGADLGAGASTSAGGGGVAEGYEDGTVGTVGIDNFDESYGGYSGEGAGGAGGEESMIGEQGMEGAGIEGDSSKDPSSPAVSHPASSSSSFTQDWRLHILSLPDGQGRCVPCNKVFKAFKAAKRHFEVMHMSPTLVECCYCHKTFNEFAFRTHMNSKHGVVGVKNVVQLYGKVIADNAENVLE